MQTLVILDTFKYGVGISLYGVGISLIHSFILIVSLGNKKYVTGLIVLKLTFLCSSCNNNVIDINRTKITINNY